MNWCPFAYNTCIDRVFIFIERAYKTQLLPIPYLSLFNIGYFTSVIPRVEVGFDHYCVGLQVKEGR